MVQLSAPPHRRLAYRRWAYPEFLGNESTAQTDLPHRDVAKRSTRLPSQRLAKPIEKSVPITIISKEHPPFDPSDDYMVQGTWSIYSGLAGQVRNFQGEHGFVKLLFHGCPLSSMRLLCPRPEKET
jgi:hypothetical protein